MSTLKVTNIQHPDAAEPAITLGANGDATIPSLPIPVAPVINYGSDRNTARPSVDGPVIWVSTVSDYPFNYALNDLVFFKDGQQEESWGVFVDGGEGVALKYVGMAFNRVL